MESIDAATRFGALAQATRLDVLRAVSATGTAGLSAGDIAARLGQAPSTLSFHLSALEQAGLLASSRHGRHIIYTMRLAGLRQLVDFLTETCCNGRPKLCGEVADLLSLDDTAPSAVFPAYNVLFLCTHNSARSIMAEAILTKVGGLKFNAYSAGSEPVKKPMPAVIARLETLGHDVGRLRSKSWDEFTGPDAPRMDFVITLCDTLDGQVCPDFGGKIVTAAWPFPDPAKFRGSKVERATTLNALYGMIRRRLEIFVNLPHASLDRMALKKRLDELGDATRYA